MSLLRSVGSMVALLLVGQGVVWADASDGQKYRASPTGSGWQLQCYNRGYFGTPEALGSACLADWSANVAGSGHSGCSPAITGYDDPTNRFWYSSGCGVGNGFVNVEGFACTGTDFDVGEVCGAEAPPECDGSITGKGFVKTHAYGASLGGTACDGGSHCRLNRGGFEGCVGASCMTVYVGTNETCTAGGGVPDIGETDADEACVSSGALEYCKNASSPGSCGFVNDDYVCIRSEADGDECFEHVDGSMLCRDGTPMPPVPDNGTAGVPATPDGDMQVGDGTTGDTYNYYNSTTVQNSERPAGGDAGGDGEGDGSGTCEGEECGPGEGSVTGGATCSAEPVCEGDAIQCAVLIQSWKARCVEGPTNEELETEFGPIANEDGSLIGTVGEYAVPESFASAGWLTDQCFEDQVADMGPILGSVTIPLSELCTLFSWLGVLIMVTAYLSGIRIVIGGI